MANVKISELTAKAATLETSDRLPIADYNGTSYTTKYVTGQEVKDLSVIMGVNSDITTSSYLTTSHQDAVTGIDATSGAVTLTIRTNANTAIDIGRQFVFYAKNVTNTITIAAEGGVTLLAAGTRVKLTEQYAVCSLMKIATNTWLLTGNLTA